MSQGPSGLGGGTSGPAPTCCAIADAPPITASTNASTRIRVILNFMSILPLYRIYSVVQKQSGTADYDIVGRSVDGSPLVSRPARLCWCRSPVGTAMRVECPDRQDRYPVRRATIGSTPAARAAGIQQPRSAEPQSHTAEAGSMPGAH